MILGDNSDETGMEEGPKMTTGRREVWNSKIEYMLSLFGYSVGIGNIWRFPYLCMRNGGGAFLIPFFFFLLTCGIPLYFMEVGLGQFSGKSPLVVWSISPLFRGIGYLMVIVSTLVACYNVLRVSDGIDNPGTIQWHLVLVLVASWFLAFCCLFKGVKSIGKVVYVTVILPYILLTVLLVRGLTLDGAVDGIIFYLKPDFSRLLKFQVWIEAGLQVFYSLGPVWGGLITMSSYNKFHNQCMQ